MSLTTCSEVESHLFGDSRGGGFSGTALGRRPQNRAKKTKCKVIFPGCLARSGRSPAGGCRCLLAWCSCPSVLRVLVVFLSLGFPPSSGDVPRNVHFLLVDARAPTQVPAFAGIPLRTIALGVPLRSTLRALRYFTCGRLSELLPAAVMDYDRSGRPSRGELVHRASLAISITPVFGVWRPSFFSGIRVFSGDWDPAAPAGVHGRLQVAVIETSASGSALMVASTGNFNLGVSKPDEEFKVQ